MMKLKDIKRYSSYLPMKKEKEEVIEWINNIIGNNWKQKFWLSKFSNYHFIRYRFGNNNKVLIYLKNKEWYSIPIDIWLQLTSMNIKTLNNDTWNWINKEKEKMGTLNIHNIINSNNKDVLDI